MAEREGKGTVEDGGLSAQRLGQVKDHAIKDELLSKRRRLIPNHLVAHLKCNRTIERFRRRAAGKICPKNGIVCIIKSIL